jgi:hypothetical protein
MLSTKSKAKLAGDKMVPHPHEGWRVVFVDFMFRSLSLPAHEFLCGLLFIYGVQLHQPTPNSILHIACFITWSGWVWKEIDGTEPDRDAINHRVVAW